LNELRAIWAADLFVVQTVGFRTLYVFFFITHQRREVVHVNVTASPTAAWIWQQFINATPWGWQPGYLIHDRDAVYGRDFPARLDRSGVASVRTPFRAPRANSIAERVIRTIRQECLDHVVVLSEGHLTKVLHEFIDYYNHDRPHRSLMMENPVMSQRSQHGPVVCRRILSGLHHVYARAARIVPTAFCHPTPRLAHWCAETALEVSSTSTSGPPHDPMQHH
jgi:transposase InsO family protein